MIINPGEQAHRGVPGIPPDRLWPPSSETEGRPRNGGKDEQKARTPDPGPRTPTYTVVVYTLRSTRPSKGG